jgi:hypothetical protein
MVYPRCPRCEQSISMNDTIMFKGNQILHLYCRRPAQLTPEERVILFRFCWDHGVADCEECRRLYRQHELGWDVFGHGALLCPRCRVDLTANVRSHLYTCLLVPSDVRKRAREARETAARLVKQSHELSDRADVLIREAEVAISKLREAMRHMISGG